MRDELELALVSDFAPWFDGYFRTVHESCLARGFECGDGWEPLIRRLCGDLRKIGPEADFRVAQVKEKFGGLRFYCDGGTDELYDRIALAIEPNPTKGGS